jgi:hypothetical protein
VPEEYERPLQEPEPELGSEAAEILGPAKECFSVQVEASTAVAREAVAVEQELELVAEEAAERAAAHTAAEVPRTLPVLRSLGLV